MKLDKQRESDNIEDRRGESDGGFGFPGGGGGGFGGRGGGMGGVGAGGLSVLLPLLFRTIGMRGIIILALVYFGLKLFTGLDLLNIVNGGGGGIEMPGNMGNVTIGRGNTPTVNPGSTANPREAAGDAGKQFISKVLASTEDVWGKTFSSMGQQYEKPPLVLFSGFTQSGCGTAQSAMGPFYCPADRKVYIDLSFYSDMKNKLGAPGDFAQAYVVAHEVGHHVQNMLGIAGKVEQARRSQSEEEANATSVKMELQADCFAGVWAQESGVSANIQLESGDIEEALNAASQIGDDRLQKRSQGYAVPESFTHGSSEQRVRWFKKGLTAKAFDDCNTFNATNL